MADAALTAAEDSVAAMVGASFEGGSHAVVAAPESDDVAKFPFDEQFQTRIAALAVSDTEFMRRTSHVLKPEFFEEIGEASLVNLALNHFKRYGEAPGAPVLFQKIKDEITELEAKLKS